MAKREKAENINDLSPHSQVKVAVVRQLVSEGTYNGLEQEDETLEPLLESIRNG